MHHHDLDFDVPDRETKAGRGPEWRILGIAIVTLMALILLVIPVGSRRRSTCAACRLDRVDHSLLGFTRSEFDPNECSRWYDAHVEPTHEHVWARLGHCRRIGIPFLFGGYACSMGDPIAGLSPSWQLEVYRHFRDPLEAKRLFTDLKRWDGRLMEAMGGWTSAGYPGTWEDWWSKHHDDGAVP